MIRRALPTRTCVGCRQRASASDLLRVVAIASVTDSGSSHFRLRPDPSRVLPGRGAHVHPVPGCLDSALRRRAFGRALRVPGVPDPGELSEAIAAVNGGDPGSSGPSRQSA
ncbi:YlxR family protein [Rhizocola hellebori]|uniref:YlxR family protein n=1 Tax=Rhizocola hellebori TaxID=1392758 RepID=UPI0019422F27|nr:YlxR family protein [Rhizocola hellebori]